MDKDLELKIENSVKEAMDDTELSIRLFRSRSVREFYQILSEDKNLDFSCDDFCDYSLKCEKLASSVLHHERPYAKKTIELVRIYGDICKNEKELSRFDSLKTLDEVLAYFNSLGCGNYSTNDVIEFFRFQYFMLFKHILNISVVRFCDPTLPANSRGLLDDSHLERVSGAGSKKRWLGSVLGAISMMTSGFGGVNVTSAYGNETAAGAGHSIEELSNLDYMDEPNGSFLQNDNGNRTSESNDVTSGLNPKGILTMAAGVLGSKLLKALMDKVGLGEYAPKDMKTLMEFPDQLKKAKDMFDKMVQKYDKSAGIKKGKKVGELITNANDELYNFLTARVKGQNEAIQKIVDLAVRPFLGDVMANALKKERMPRYSDNISPENVRTYVASMYGDRGVGKTRCMNILQDEVFNNNGIPCVTIPVGDFVGYKGKMSFVEWLSQQDVFLSKLDEIRYMKNFVLCFDEVDKLDDSAQLLQFMEYIRNVADKTQITYKDMSGGDKNPKISTIQCESGLVILSSNALGPNERGGAGWRKKSLSDDPSVLSRMSHIIFNRANDDTADAVADTLIMEVQSDWYQINGVNIELDDTFTFNALRVLKYLGYDPNKDGVREIRNQIISMMKTEFSRKYTKILQDYNNFIANGKDPRKIRFLFRWEKPKADEENMALMGKNGKISPIVPVLSCRYVGDVNKLSVRVFDQKLGIHSSKLADGNNVIWSHLGKRDVDGFRDFMERLELWKLWANNGRIENAKKGVYDVAKFKIRDAYRMLRYCMISEMVSHRSKDASAKDLVRRLGKWKRSARLTVAEKELIFDGLSEMIGQWREGANADAGSK